MSKYARYLSFSQGELEQRLKEIGTAPHLASSVALSLRAAGSATTSSGASGTRGRGRLIKSHSCPVQFPDGQTGSCQYTRGGPRWHLFRYEYQGANGKAILPVQYYTDLMGNDLVSIEHAANEKATKAFADAVKREQKEYFMRSTEGMRRRIRPTCFQMKASRAKQLAGRYALCHKLGQRLLPIGGTYTTLEEANQALQEQGESSILVVACCNRLDRCWEQPKFNPLRPAPVSETAPPMAPVVTAAAATLPTGTRAAPAPVTMASNASPEATPWNDDEDPEWDYLPDDGDEGDDTEEGEDEC